MNKDKILELLKPEDLKANPQLYEIAVGSECGLDTIKDLYKHHETMELRITYLKSCEPVIQRYISMYKDLSVSQLSRDTGWSQEKIKKTLKKLHKY